MRAQVALETSSRRTGAGKLLGLSISQHSYADSIWDEDLEPVQRRFEETETAFGQEDSTSPIRLLGRMAKFNKLVHELVHKKHIRPHMVGWKEISFERWNHLLDKGLA